jgi:hypothetical protein
MATFELKRLSREAVPRALEKAERYRLLNEPAEAESICQDVLRVDPDNQEALVALLLALTDQFQHGLAVREARDLLPRIADPYERLYYEGLVCERQAKVQLEHGGPGSGFAAYEWFREAMTCYERAEAIRPAGNDDAMLRWNTCARALMRSPQLAPPPRESLEPQLE